MAVSPKNGFDFALERAEHFLTLYSLLKNTRRRAVRKDWAAKCKTLMKWPATEKIIRVDGAGKQSILLVRPAAGLTDNHFNHEYCSELLRGSVVTAVSALDKYFHDLVVYRSWKLLSQREEFIPTELKKISLPVLTAKRSLERLRNDKSARPGSLIKQAIQEQLHREFTFQKPDSLARGAKMLGIDDFWTKVAAVMAGGVARADIIKKLTEIADRRNHIVHEADVIRKTRARKYSSRELTETVARDYVSWIRDLVAAIDQVAH